MNKKIFITAATIFALATCAAGHAKTLTVYYSFTNNVHTIVNDLRTQIDTDVVRIEPAEEGLDYAANNYAIGSALIAAIRENPDDAASYPAIKPVDVNFADYETIIVAAPLWWGNMAAPLQTFLFNHGAEMANKNIGLIVSSASSGIEGVESDARRLIPNGNFLNPSLWIRSSQTSNCHSLLADWLIDIDYSNIASSATVAIGNDGITIASKQGELLVVGEFKTLSLFNSIGSKVVETSDGHINTSSLGRGLYIARIDRGRGKSIRKKIYIAN